jgi:ribonucleotide reductase alpha subunit
MNNRQRYVINRRGERVKLSLDKINDRLEEVSDKISVSGSINLFEIVGIVISRMIKDMKTSEIDTLIAAECIGKMLEHEDYYRIASAISISNLHRTLFDAYGGHSFTKMVKRAIAHIDTSDNTPFPLIDAKWLAFITEHEERINTSIDYDRDYIIDYFGVSTLIKNRYLLIDANGDIIESPSDMYMRTAINCYSSLGIDVVIQAYNYLSKHYYTHATPTMINSMTPCGQLASCFLINHVADSIEGMYGGDGIEGTVSKVASISKNSGGIGIALHNIRSSGMKVRTTNGKTSGLKPYVKVYNEIAGHVDQGSKRPGAIAIYLTPVHPDFVTVMKMKRQEGAAKDQATSLFYACWIPDEFMRRVKQAILEDENKNILWSTFDYNKFPELYNCYGDEFTNLYNSLEAKGLATSQQSILEIWDDIHRTQRLAGMPYVMYSDACNEKSNQKNLGYIASSNLCVHGETTINIRNSVGCIKEERIDSLVDQTIEIWNGFIWSSVTIKKTGENQHLLNISTSDGKSIKCTRYHKFILYDENCINEARRTDAETLKIGDLLYDKHFTRENEESHKGISITDISNVDGLHDTFCFTEPINHTGVFNGILTGNCSEIVEFSSPDETAVCNLASMSLPAFVDQKTKTFNHEKFYEVVKFAIRGLDSVIDENKYPTKCGERSNMRHRPVGLGIQGLVDVYLMLNIAFESPEAYEVNRDIHETMYFAAMESSVELAEEKGAYSSFPGSPLSQGKFQFDLWKKPIIKSGRYDWDALRARVVSSGARNSLLIALMPTAGTSQIMGNVEMFENIPGHIYKRETKTGNYIVINQHIIRLLRKYNKYNLDVNNSILINRGSIQHLTFLTEHERNVFKTVWEIKQKAVIEQSAERGRYVCQSQSMNIYFAEPDRSKLSAAHIYAWDLGLKTGSYYIRSQPSTTENMSISITSKNSNNQDQPPPPQETEYDGPVCTMQDGCISCGS